MNELVQVLILVAEVLEVGGHGILLVGRARKVVREAASGDPRSDLGSVIRRAANGSDPWTYESVVVL